MNHLLSFFLPLGTLILSHTSLGEEQITFLQKYKEAIQDYIMTGHEYGWKQCEIMSDGLSLIEGDIGENTPYVSMEQNKMVTLNVKSAFASSNCLLVVSHVASVNALNTILDFGRNTFLHKRLALVLTMETGINLHMATNITKLPFLVAAKSDDGKAQFLCPAVGKQSPWLKQEICDPSYVSYENKSITVGIMGVYPYFVNSNLGHDGIDIRLLTMLEDRLKFNADIVVPSSFLDSVDVVCSLSRKLCIRKNIFPLLQSNDRETDMSLCRWNYASAYFIHNDFIGPLNTYDIHFLSAAPQEIRGSLGLIRVFDQSTWVILIISVVVVTIVLVIMKHWSKSTDTTYQCKYEVRGAGHLK